MLSAPHDQPTGNPWIFRMPDRRFTMVETTDPVLPLLGFLDNDLHDFGPFKLLLSSPQRLARDYMHHVKAGGPTLHFPLAREVARLGEAYLRGRGIDPAEPFVLLHVRDRAYLPEKAHLTFRCSDIANYRPAVDRLLGAGFRVVRIGDRTSPPLAHPSERVMDLPFLADYAGWMDVYFAARCAFAVGTTSGPDTVMRAFGRNVLTANQVYEQQRLPLAGDLQLFKRYRDGASGRLLGYAEILDRGLPMKGASTDYEALGIAIEENMPEQIDDAVAEMIEMQARQGSPDPVVHERFHALGRAHLARSVADPALAGRYFDTFGYDAPHVRLARAQFFGQPDYLD